MLSPKTHYDLSLETSHYVNPTIYTGGQWRSHCSSHSPFHWITFLPKTPSNLFLSTNCRLTPRYSILCVNKEKRANINKPNQPVHQTESVNAHWFEETIQCFLLQLRDVGKEQGCWCAPTNGKTRNILVQLAILKKTRPLFTHRHPTGTHQAFCTGAVSPKKYWGSFSVVKFDKRYYWKDPQTLWVLLFKSSILHTSHGQNTDLPWNPYL